MHGNKHFLQSKSLGSENCQIWPHARWIRVNKSKWRFPNYKFFGTPSHTCGVSLEGIAMMLQLKREKSKERFS